MQKQQSQFKNPSSVVVWRSDQCHLDCFLVQLVLVPGPLVPHFFEASSRNLWERPSHSSLVIMQFTSSTW